MGYTHYWAGPRALPRPQFVAAVEDCRRLCAALDIPLGNGVGEGQPIFTAARICFNGHIDSRRLVTNPPASGIAGQMKVVIETEEVSGADPTVPIRILNPDGSGVFETFLVERVRKPRYPQEQPKSGKWFSFCKTSYRPYDLCVQGCLIVLSHHLGKATFGVDSDGTSAQWDQARSACQEILGYGLDWHDGGFARDNA